MEKDKKLKILVINYEFPPLGGGGGVASYDLAVEWAKKGQVDVLTSSYQDLSSFEVVDGINVHRVKVLFRKSRDAASFLSMLTYLPAAFFKGYALAKKNRYDVINTHFAVPSGPVGYLLGKLFRIPNVLSIHGGDIYDPSKKMSPHRSVIFRKIVKFILNKADGIVAQSSNTRDNAVTYYNPKKSVEIIPLAYHPPVVAKTSRKKLGLAADDFVLVSIGRIVKRKSLDVLITALSKIKNKKIKLYVMGDGPERENLENLTKELSLTERVKFLGYMSNELKNEYLSQADLFTLVSMHEGFGIVYMEGMFFGLPIVCTNHGGQIDFLKNEENAILINVGDVDACAKAIERFHKDEKLYAKCSRNNRKKIKDFYAENVAGQYYEYFMKLVK